MEQIRDSVLKCLERYKREDRLIKELNVLADNGGPEVYSDHFPRFDESGHRTG